MGFEISDHQLTAIAEKNKVPGFMSLLDELEISDLDVRPIIASGKDPLTLIKETVKTLKAGKVLRIINSFEPTPLMFLLKKQGFESFADRTNEKRVDTYFYKQEAVIPVAQVSLPDGASGWNIVMERFKNAMQFLDVRSLEMPLPMLTILDALDKLTAGTALFVYHKRIPVYLLPELAERNFSYRIKEISTEEVHLLIFKN